MTPRPSSPEGENTDPNLFKADRDPATTTDPTNPDTDGDGLSDGQEDANQNGQVDPGESSPLIQDAGIGPDHRISGSGYNLPFALSYRASFSMSITGPTTLSGSLKYYYSRTRIYFVSTQITTLSISSGNVATISGKGKVNGVEGYTFTAIVSNGAPDQFSISIRNPDGSLLYFTGPDELTGGDLRISPL